MNKKALIITWGGYQDQEVIYPYYRVLEDEYEVSIMAEKVGTINGILGTSIRANNCIADLDLDRILFSENMLLNITDLLILPGGVKALEKLRQQKSVLQFIKDFQATGKVISSTCHGAQLLISAGLTKGRKISGYYSIADDIRNSGAEYVDAPYVIDGNIISSPHYKHMGPWMKATLDLVEKLKNDNQSH